MDSTVRQTPDGLRDEAVGAVMYASGIRLGDVILSGGRQEPVVGDPVRTGDVVAVPTTVDGATRTRTFGAGSPVVVLRPAPPVADDGDLVDGHEGAVDREPERIAAGEVRRGMVLDVSRPGVDPDYREVAHVEPVVDDVEPVVLLVYRGGRTMRYERDVSLRLVPEAEWAERKKIIREGEKRVRMRAALTRMVELFDAGLPLPYRIEVEFSLLPTADDVRRAAELLGAEVIDKTRPDGQPSFEVKAELSAGQAANLRDAEVVLRMWHLGDRPVRPADEPPASGS